MIGKTSIKSKPLISVVVPNYNRQEMICDALNSVENQTHRPIELIVVDDGSTDNSIEVISAWLAQHGKADFFGKLIHQQNAGGNAARNAGIMDSTAQYVAFLDSDDLWHNDKLEKQLHKLNESSKAGAVYCGLQHVDAATGNIIERVERTYIQGNIIYR